MASTLLFSTFDVPFNSINISPAATSDSDLSIYNWIGGRRYSYGQFAAAAASNSVRFDLSSSVTKSSNHLIIARADILKTSGTTAVTLSRGTDGVAFTTEYTDASFASATLYGPRSDDYLAEFTASSAYEWWKIAFTAASSKFCCSKISFGTAFDIGKNVDDYKVDRVPAKEALWYSDAGSEFQTRVEEEVYRFYFRWKGVTASNSGTFFNTIGRWGYRQPFFLYTPSAGNQHVLLDNQRVMHVRLLEARKTSDKNNYHEIEASFEECLG